MSTIIALVAGFLTGRLLWMLLRGTMHGPLFIRRNWRGNEIPTAVGIVFPLALLVVEAGRSLAAAADIGETTLSGGRIALLLVAIGFGGLGLLDDLAGDDNAKGFRGHVGALLLGRLTTGGVKLLGGFALSLVVVTGAGDGPGQLVADAALVALAANFANLVDRRPGRCVKVAGVGYAFVLFAGFGTATVLGISVLIGAAAALALDDLHERVMLGDTGANVLGAALGLAIVLTAAPATRLVALAVVVALNLLSEVVSFSKVIDSVGPLKRVDQAGQRRHVNTI